MDNRHQRVFSSKTSRGSHCNSNDTVVGVEYEGEKGQPGYVRIVKFHKSINEFQHVKERIEEVDHEKLRLKMSVIEGGLAAVFKDVKIELEFKEGANADTTIAKSMIEYGVEQELLYVFDEADDKSSFHRRTEKG